MSSGESDQDGFIVEVGDLGLRLKAMTAEVGLFSSNTTIKFVLAESLSPNGNDQISRFINEHRCEGLQHIALLTSDISHCVSRLTQFGLKFNEPPPTYYSEVGKLDEIVKMGEDAASMKKHGILIDMDHDGSGYLMQKFTRPIFGIDTFFFEFIQRKGSHGFGSGNVSALWRSLEEYLKNKQQ